MSSATGCSKFESNSGYLKASFIIIGVSFISHCVGIGTSYWVYYSPSDGYSTRFGLWSFCACFTATATYPDSSGTCFCSSLSQTLDNGWIVITRLLEVVGLLMVFALGVVLLTQLFFISNRAIKLVGIFLTISAGITTLTGVAVFGVKQMFALNFSFGFCAVSGVLCLLCAFLLILDRRNFSGPREHARGGHIISQHPSYPMQTYITSDGHLANYAHAQSALPPSYTALTSKDGATQMTSLYGEPPPYSEVENTKMSS